MLYDSYHAKISKIVVFLRKIFKHIVLISIVAGVLLAALVGFMITKGKILDDTSLADDFDLTYGDTLPIKASAMFGKVSYEYSTDGVAWSAEAPLRPGEYFVRATAKSVFGQARHGKTYTFELMPKEIEVFVYVDEMMYGETPSVSADLSFNDKVVCDGFVYADRFAKKTNISPDLSSVKIYTEEEVDVTDSYIIKAKTTDITVNPRPILITVSDEVMIYNDTKFSYDGYELSGGTLASGDVIQATFNKYLIDVGSIENTPELRVVTSDGFDTSVHYDISTEIGDITVDYRPIIIQTPNAEKVYDDTELFNDNFEVIGEYDIVEGHIAECVSKTTITDVDECENILIVEVKNANGEDKTENYSLFYETGMLKITPRPITVSPVDGTWEYDGTEHSGEYVTEGLVDGHSLSAFTSTIIDAGKTDNEVFVETITNAYGEDVSFNYDIGYGNIATLEITKRPITIVYESGNVVYDGLEHTFDVYKDEQGHDLTFAAGDGFVFTFPKFRWAGTYVNKPEVKITALRKNDAGTLELKTFEFSDNYDVTEISGTVVIEKCEITLKPIDFTKEYDGIAYQPESYDIVNGILPEGHSIDVKYMLLDDGINAGTHYVKIDQENTAIWFDSMPELSNSVTNNFNITFEDGILEILPRFLELTANSDSKPYDGTPLTNNGFEITDGSLVSGHSLSALVYGSQTEIGTSDNVIDERSIVITDANGFAVKLENYDISCVNGSLEVRQRYLSVTANSDSKEYNGEPLFGTSVVVDELSEYNDGLIDGHYISDIVLSGSITNRGSTDNFIESIEIYDADGNPVTQYYAIEKHNGTLTIRPRPITVKTDDISKEYNGEPLEAVWGPNSSVSDLLAKDTVSFIPNNSITDVGEADNEIVLSITDSITGLDMIEAGNYEITYEYGTLTVTPRMIVIKTSSAHKIYDGTPLMNTENFESNISDVLLPKDRFDGYLSFSTITDAGFTDNKVSFQIIDSSTNEDMFEKGNYAIDVENSDIGVLTVYKRSLTLVPTPVEYSKVYDGTPFECRNYMISNGGLANGEYIESILFSSIKPDAKDDPYILTLARITVRNMDLDDTTNNYEFTVEEIPVFIGRRDITVTSGSAEKAYDGKPLVYKAIFTVENSPYELVLGHWIRCDNVMGKQIEIGSSPNTIDGPVVIFDDDGNLVTHNYNVIQLEGTLTVVDPSEGGGEGPGGGPGGGDLPGNLIPLKINLDVLVKLYDGSRALYGYSNFYEVRSELPDGYTVTVKYNYSNSNAYTLTVGDINTNIDAVIKYKMGFGEEEVEPYFIIEVFDDSGMDVSDNYLPIIVPYNELGSDEDVIVQIKPINITFEAESDECYYIENTILSNPNAFIRRGSLLDGHYFVAKVVGELDKIGTVENELLGVTIYDANDNDVTANYNIKLRNGLLEFLAPEEE